MSILDVGTLRAFLTVDSQGLIRGLREGDRSLSSFLKAGTIAAAAGGVAIGAALGASLVKAMNVEKANDKLAAQLGLSADQAKVAGERAANLYAGAWGDSLEQVNEAVAAVMTSMDIPDAEIEGMTANVLDLASAYEIDVTRAAQVAGQMITTGLAKDGTQAMDLLAGSMQKVPAALREDLLDAVDEYGPAFAAVGVSGEQAMGLLVDASDKGMYGIDKVGDAVKEFGIRSTDMSAASGAAYQALGMDQEAMSNALLAGGDTASDAFSKIVGGLQGMTDPAAQSAAAIALFGTPLEDLNVTEIPAFLGSLDATKAGLEGTDGAMKGLSDTLNGNAATSWEGVKRQVGLLASDLGARLLPAASGVANYLASNLGPGLDRVASVMSGSVVPAMQAGARWIQANATPIGVIAALIGAVFLPALIAAGVQATISGAKQAAAWAVSQAGAVRTAAVQSVAVVGVVAGWVLMGVQSLIGAARMAAAWLIALGPVGLVIAAVIGIAALIIANWDTIKRVTENLWKAVAGFFVRLWDDAKRIFLAGIALVVGFVRDNWKTILAFLAGPIGLAVLAIIKHWDGIKAAFFAGRDAVVGAAKWIGDKVVGAFESLRDRGRSAFEGLRDGIARAMGQARALAAKPINFIISTVYNGGIRALYNKVAETVGMKSRLPTLPAIAERRKGGATPAGMTLVGEEGPELVNFAQPSMVYTAAQTRNLMATQDNDHTDAPALPMGGGEGSAGPVGWVGEKLASVKDWIVGGLKSVLTAGTSKLMAGLPPAGLFGEAAGAAAKQMIAGLLNFGGREDDKAASAGGVVDAGGPLPPMVGGWMRPMRGGRVTSEFGMRTNPVSGKYKLHDGIDISGASDGLTRAMAAGKVIQAGGGGGYGNYIRVAHANGYTTGYAHHASMLVSAGQNVAQGQPLGREGSTGNSTGKHLHQNLKNPSGGWVNPRSLGVYDKGGTLKPGHTALNLGRGNETVLPPAESKALTVLGAGVERLLAGPGGVPEALVVVDTGGKVLMHLRTAADQSVAANDRAAATGAYYQGSMG